MRSIYLLLAMLGTVAFIFTLKLWLLIWIAFFLVVAGIDAWLDERVAREQWKTCTCPLCKTNRSDS